MGILSWIYKGCGIVKSFIEDSLTQPEARPVLKMLPETVQGRRFARQVSLRSRTNNRPDSRNRLEGKQNFNELEA